MGGARQPCFQESARRKSIGTRSVARVARVALVAIIERSSTFMNDHRRFLTTHVGSLPRTEELKQLMFAREDGLPFSPVCSR